MLEINLRGYCDMAYLFRFIKDGKTTGIYGYSEWDDYAGLFYDIIAHGDPCECEIAQSCSVGSFLFTYSSDKEWPFKVKEMADTDGLSLLLELAKDHWRPFPQDYTLRHALGVEKYFHGFNDDVF